MKIELDKESKELIEKEKGLTASKRLLNMIGRKLVKQKLEK